jgi:hypothetical protein
MTEGLRLPRLNADAFRLAMTKGEWIVSLLAMTIGWTQKSVIASLPKGGVAISICILPVIGPRN